MTITLNGTTGITTPSIVADTDTLYVDATNDKVGIGTSSPSQKLTVSTTSNDVMSVISTSDTNADLYLKATGTTLGNVRLRANANDMVFIAGLAERARIDSSGNLLVGTTTSLANGLTVTGGNGPQFSLNTTTRFTQFNLYNSGSQKGFIAFDNDLTRLIIQNSSAGVYLSSGATSWTSNSDERNKDIIEPISDAVNKVSTLRTVIGKYKTDEEGTRRSFLIAQDVQAVFPEAVEASNPDDLGVNYTDVIPLLVASIKELKAELDTVKTELATLKGTA